MISASTFTSFTEFGLEFKYHCTPAHENINQLIEALRQENLSCQNRYHYVVLLDEVLLWDNHYDLTDLNLEVPEIDIHIAINPFTFAGEAKPFEVKLSASNNIYCARLTWKHRNSREICNFLTHLKDYILNDLIQYSTLDDYEDKSLDESGFSLNQMPIWIMAKETMKHEEILDSIEKQQNLPRDRSVTLLLQDDLEGKESVEKWCQNHGWNIVENDEMMGSESKIYVTYEIDLARIEYYSRARNKLVILTR